MKIYTTAPMEDPRDARVRFAQLEAIGYDSAFSFEARLDPFLPHVEHRFSMPWSKPASRMREIVLAIKAIFDCWEGRSQLDFRGEFYHHTLMIPAFDPGPNPFGPPPIFLGGFGPLMTAVAGETADGFFAHHRAPDPAQWSDIVADLKRAPA